MTTRRARARTHLSRCSNLPAMPAYAPSSRSVPRRKVIPAPARRGARQQDLPHRVPPLPHVAAPRTALSLFAFVLSNSSEGGVAPRRAARLKSASAPAACPSLSLHTIPFPREPFSTSPAPFLTSGVARARAMREIHHLPFFPLHPRSFARRAPSSLSLSLSCALPVLAPLATPPHKLLRPHVM